VAAVASRDADRSRKFIEDCQQKDPFTPAPVALGSYEALLESKDIDAVYIPLPTGVRKDWVLRAAASGKHVLCEKPCGVNAADVREMIEACRQHRVQFMDGVMFMHNPRLDRIRKILDEGKELGTIKRITSVFSFAMGADVFEENVRVNSELEPAGSLGDLGWYCIRFTLWAMGWRLPREVSGRILLERGSRRSPAPVPIDFSGELIFDKQTSAGFFSSFSAQFQQWVNIGGAKGFLHLADFVHPQSDHEPTFQLNQSQVSVKACRCAGDHNEDRTPAQAPTMMRNFANQVRSGKLNADWPDFALKTQQVLDACLKSARAGGRAVSLDS
jgi:predicted dehydrogenase